MKKIIIGSSLVCSLLFSQSAFAFESAKVSQNSNVKVLNTEYTQLEKDEKKYYPNDVETHWANDTLTDFVDSDLLSGYSNSDGSVSVKPNNKVTRAEFTAFLIRALGTSSSGTGKKFTDVKSTDWFYDVVNTASGANYIGGVTANEFAPNKNITRAEMAAILVRALEGSVNFSGTEKQFPDVKQHWAKDVISSASKVGIISGYGDGSFKPNGEATRAEAVVMIQRALDKQQNKVAVDSVLTNLVINYHTETLAAYNNHNASELSAFAEKYTVGYNKVAEKMSYLAFLEYLETGVTVKFLNPSTPTASVEAKSNNFAVVELLNSNFEYVENLGTSEEARVNDNYDGFYYLKRIPSTNQWKIYSIYYNE